jgi:hypothetical protein
MAVGSAACVVVIADRTNRHASVRTICFMVFSRV